MPSTVTPEDKAATARVPTPDNGVPAPAEPGLSGGIPNLKNRIPKLEPRRRKQAPENPVPPPETPLLPPPPDASTVAFKTPTRRILSPRDHELFLVSPTYNLILGWIFGLSDAVTGTPISAVKDADLSPAVQNILRILDDVDALLDETPPDDQAGSRFGNKTFRFFLDKIKQRAPAWHATLGVPDGAATAEVSTYLTQAFGNRRRIDYGSGHELNFAIWLLCLDRLGTVGGGDRRALGLRVFARYLALMRRVQLTYYLEPAGSHGVWGLDDYQFLPFLLGAAQLRGHAYITPRAIHHELTVEQFGPDYLYLGQVAFVNGTKTVRGLRWHSPMLDDISGARDWAKVEAGMRRMFVAEVLRKLPVMQHFLFGGLVPAAEDMSEHALVTGPEEDDEEDLEDQGEVKVFDKDGVRHVHNPSGWGDCCGIKVPSSVAASEEMRKRGLGGGLRRIPFD